MDEDFGEDILERGVAMVMGKKKGKVKAHGTGAMLHARNYDWRWDPAALTRHREEEDIETGKVTWVAAQKGKKVKRRSGKNKRMFGWGAKSESLAEQPPPVEQPVFEIGPRTRSRGRLIRQME